MLFRFFTILAVILLINSCSAGSRKHKHELPDKRLNFVFITCLVDEQFFMPVKKGMSDAARMLDVDCRFTGTKGVDVPAQAELVRQAIRDRVDGIALNIIDPIGFDSVIEEAALAGIPLVAFNIDDPSSPNKRLSSVNQQLYHAGKTLGQKAAGFIPDGSEILMTMHDEGVSALEDRLRGAQDGLVEAGKTGISWRIVITGSTVAESTRVIAEELKSHPEIKYVLCTGQADTEGAGQALGQIFPNKGYKACGFDLSPAILKSILDGDLAFTIDQQPYIQGFYPVVQLSLFKRYGIRPSNMDAGAAIIDSTNAASVIALSKQHYR